jgi:transcriptional regulator with XRE-family HTH domain
VDRAELAHFLRAARRRIDVGLPREGLRRTPGLRREEVAKLASVSVDTYTRLEQGRGAEPSVAVLEALARALRLTPDERAHLFHLTGHPDPPGGHPERALSPAVLHLLDRMSDTAAYVVDAAGFILAWNPLAAALIADFSRWPPAERNLTWQVFCGTVGPHRDYSGEQWEAFARDCVAELRAAAARYPYDPAIAALVARLRRHSPLFAEWWDEHHVRRRRSATKRMGELELDVDILLVQDYDQRIIIYSARPGSSSAAAMRRLTCRRSRGREETARPAPA